MALSVKSIVFIAFFLFTRFSLQAEENRFLPLADNWLYFQTKLPETIDHDALNPLLEKAESVTIPRIVTSFPEENRMHSYSRILPPLQECLDCILFLSTLSDPAMIFLNGERIFDLGTAAFPDKLEYLGRGPFLIPVKKSFSENRLTLVLIDDDGGYAGLLGDVFYGERAEIMRLLLLRDIDKIVLWGLFLGISIVSMLLFFLDRKKINFLILAVDTLAMMIFSISMSDFLAFIIDDISILEFLQAKAAVVVVSFYLFFLSTTSRIRWISIFGVVIISYGLIFFVLLSQRANSIAGVYFDSAAAVTMLCGIISVLLFTKERSIKRVFTISFLIVIPVTLHDILVMQALLPYTLFLIPWGMAATFFPFIYHQIVTFTSIEKTLVERDRELLQEKIRNLKDKMKPHFVRNTLAIISSYIMKDSEKAKASVDNLAACYNFLLQSDRKQLIPLEEELEFVKNYGDILLIKFSDVLGIKYHFKGELSGVMIPPLTLQPIVENAYNHGVRRLKRGTIDVNVDVDEGNGRVKISVTNPNNRKPMDDPFSGTLGSIRRRLQFFFEEADISLVSENKITAVSVQYGKMKNLQEINRN